jgi:hypothetical protein
VLRQPDRPATDQELYEAALQYVRKISGFRKPARANQEAFDAAVLEIAAVSRALLERLPARKQPSASHVHAHDGHPHDHEHGHDHVHGTAGAAT